MLTLSLELTDCGLKEIHDTFFPTRLDVWKMHNNLNLSVNRRDDIQKDRKYKNIRYYISMEVSFYFRNIRSVM